MTSYAQYLDWIDSQHNLMCRLLAHWAEINSGSGNLPGLQQLAGSIMTEFAVLGGEIKLISLPPQTQIDVNGATRFRPLGKAVQITKRPDAPFRVLLAIHMDTVYGADSPFQRTTQLDPLTLQGPGVADAKGGLIVMLKALEALECSPLAQHIGWDVVINPDEELGSPGSAGLLSMVARGCRLGMLFEPALPNGSLVGARKGSGNFTAMITGKSAHAGRNPGEGHSAINAMAEFILAIAALNSGMPGLTTNVGRVEGGTTPNVVADRALCRFNVRIDSTQQGDWFRLRLDQLVHDFNERDGITLKISGDFTAPPKPLNDRVQKLLEHVVGCGRDLGLNLSWHSSGGVCDGNRLAAAGLPNVDTLGVCGGNLHSPEEFVHLESLAERAKLSALLLMKLASGEIDWPEQKNT